MAKRLAKTTPKQYGELLHFVSKHKIVLMGKTKPTEVKQIDKLWIEFSTYINSLGYGPQKTPGQWRHVFNEWKVNTRRKSRDIARYLKDTGGGPPTTKQLTDLEEQLLSLIGYIHLGHPSVSDSLRIQEYNSNADGAHSEDANVKANVETPSGLEEEDILLELEKDDMDNCEPSSYLTLSSNNKENSPEVVPIHLLSGKNTLEPGPSTVSTPRTQRPTLTSKKSRSNLEEATKHYENAQKLNLEKEKAKAAALTKLASTMDNFTNTYKCIENGKLKLAYYREFQTFEGFENLFK